MLTRILILILAGLSHLFLLDGIFAQLGELALVLVQALLHVFLLHIAAQLLFKVN